MISFCKIFYVSFIELLVLLHSLYRYFMGSDPNIQKYDIPELQTFINGIKKDLTAVKNGIIYALRQMQPVFRFLNLHTFFEYPVINCLLVELCNVLPNNQKIVYYNSVFLFFSGIF